MKTENTYEPRAQRIDKILYRVYREVAEILLKVITWSVMIGAVKYAGEI